jgi:hypothetical protein
MGSAVFGADPVPSVRTLAGGVSASVNQLENNPLHS